MPIKLIHLDLRTKIATLECGCGGRMLLPTTGATADKPAHVRCPMCGKVMAYPNDLEK
jgi:ribosomal protein S27E